jgi:tape measure domain-containing protein
MPPRHIPIVLTVTEDPKNKQTYASVKKGVEDAMPGRFKLVNPFAPSPQQIEAAQKMMQQFQRLKAAGVDLAALAGQMRQAETATRAFTTTTGAGLKNVTREAQAVSTAARGLSGAFRDAEGKIRSSLSSVGSAVKSVASETAGLAKTALSFVGGGLILGGLRSVTGGIAGVGEAVFDMRERVDRARLGFEALLGTAAKADDVIAKIRALRDETKGNLGDLVEGAQRLVGVGLSPDKTVEILRGLAVGAKAFGSTNEQLQGVIVAASQIIGKGKLQAEELEQLAERGFGSARRILAEAAGVTERQLRELGEQGKINGLAAIELLAGELQRRFPDALKKAGGTIGVTFNDLKQKATLAAVDALDPLGDRVQSLANKVNDFLSPERLRAFSSGVATFLEGSLGTIGEIVDKFGRGDFAGAFGQLAQSVGSVIGPLLKPVADLFAEKIAGAFDLISKPLSAAAELFGKAVDLLAQIPAAITELLRKIPGVGSLIGADAATLPNYRPVVATYQRAAQTPPPTPPRAEELRQLHQGQPMTAEQLREYQRAAKLKPPGKVEDPFKGLPDLTVIEHAQQAQEALKLTPSQLDPRNSGGGAVTATVTVLPTIREQLQQEAAQTANAALGISDILRGLSGGFDKLLKGDFQGLVKSLTDSAAVKELPKAAEAAKALTSSVAGGVQSAAAFSADKARENLARLTAGMKQQVSGLMKDIQASVGNGLESLLSGDLEGFKRGATGIFQAIKQEFVKNIVDGIFNRQGGGALASGTAARGSGGGFLDRLLSIFKPGSGGSFFDLFKTQSVGPGGTPPTFPAGAATTGFRGALNKLSANFLGFPLFKAGGAAATTGTLAPAIASNSASIGVIHEATHAASGAASSAGATGATGALSTLSSLAGPIGLAIAGHVAFRGLLNKVLGNSTAGRVANNVLNAVLFGAATFGLFKLFSGRELDSYKKLVQGEYGVKVDTDTAKQLREVGKQLFGKEYRRKQIETIRAEQGKEIIAAYAEATGQQARNLRLAKDLANPNNPANLFVKRERGGPVYPGIDYLVGERRPEVFRPTVPGVIIPSVPQAMASGGGGQAPGGQSSGGGQGDGELKALLRQIVGMLSGNTAMMERLDGLLGRVEGMPPGRVLTMGAKQNPRAISDSVRATQNGDAGFSNGFLADAGF